MTDENEGNGSPKAEQELEAAAEDRSEDNGSVRVGFDFHLSTTRLNSRRLWLTVFTLSGALGLIVTALQLIRSWLAKMFP